MSYATGETAALALIRAHANYGTKNASQGDWTILSYGGDDFVVLRQGEIPLRERATAGAGTRSTWITKVVVIRRFRDASVSEKGLQAAVAVVIGIFDKYPHLNAGSAYQRAMIVGADDTFAMGGSETTPAFIAKELDLQWEENETISYAE